MHELALKLDNLTKEFRTKLPKSEGLVLQSTACKAARQRAQQVSEKYKSLPLKIRRGRFRSNWKVRNRVGTKVEQLKKVIYMYIISMHTLTYVYNYIHNQLPQAAELFVRQGPKTMREANDYNKSPTEDSQTKSQTAASLISHLGSYFCRIAYFIYVLVNI